MPSTKSEIAGVDIHLYFKAHILAITSIYFSVMCVG